MKRVLAIATNTFKETIRDRILYLLVFFAAVMSLLSVILGSLSIGNNVKIILDFGLAAIQIFGLIIAIFVGTSLVFKEIDRKTIYVILSKPINRWEFIVGKFLGLCITLTVIILLMSVIYVLLLYIYGITPKEIYLAILALGMILLELYLTTAVAILFSTFSTPLLSMVFVLGVWIIGHFNPVMLSLAEYSNNPALLELVRIFHYILPDLSKFNLKNNIDNLDYIVDYSHLCMVVLYGLLYTTALLMVSVFSFQRKEFN